MFKKRLSKKSKQTKSDSSKTADETQIATQTHSEQDNARIDEYRRRHNAPKPVKISQDKNGDTVLQEKKEFWDISLMEATGTVDRDLADTLITQVGHTVPGGNTDPAKTLNKSLAAMHDIAPRDTLEGMLAAQMVGAHNLGMECMKRAMIEGQHTDAIKSYLSLGNKCMRTFTQQIETLNRYRGKGQQKMTVEHVHVNKGGQAIVGNVTGGMGVIDEK